MTVAARDLTVVLPDPATIPPLSPIALLACLVGIVPAFATPPPVLGPDAECRGRPGRAGGERLAHVA